MPLSAKEMERFKDFQDSIMDEVGSLGSEVNLSSALLKVFEPILVEQGDTQEIHLVSHEDTTGRNRCKFDGFCLNDSVDRVDLFISFLVEEENAQIGWSEIEKVAQKAARTLRYASNGDFERFEGEAQDTVVTISKEMGLRKTGRIFVITNGIIRNPDTFIENESIEGFKLSIEAYDLVRFDRLNSSTSSLDDIYIDFESIFGKGLPCVEEKNPNKDYSSFLAILPGDLVFDLFEKFGPKLYEYNVRSFLQARGKVNKGIRDTLINEPDKFLAYNNGIVATASEIEIETEYSHPIIKSVRGLQIVNGAQSTASIHRAKKVDGADLSNVSLSAKFTLLKGELNENFVSNVSLYANSQNNIQIADLSANNPILIGIERLSEITWCPGEQSKWFFDRARGSYQMAQFQAGTTKSKREKFKEECPPNQVIKKTDISKVFNCWDLKPHYVAAGAQKNFSNFMADLKDAGYKDWEPDKEYYVKLVALIIIYKAIEKEIRAQKFPAYRSTIANYLLAFLSLKAETSLDFDYIWQNQSISEAFQREIRRLAPIIDKSIRKAAGALNVTEYAKKEACWNEIQSTDYAMPSGSIPEFGGDPEPVVESDESNLIAWVRSLDLEDLATMQFFGHTSNKLKDLETRIIGTVINYAKAGWPNPNHPSIKQSRHIRNAHRVCKKEGLFS